MTPTKVCTKCHETKPLTDFHRDAKSSGGRRGDCAECARARNVRRPKRSRPAITDRGACHYSRCRRPATMSSGLCGTHHAILTADRESPLALTGGAWVAGVAGVRRWVA